MSRDNVKGRRKNMFIINVNLELNVIMHVLKRIVDKNEPIITHPRYLL
jgi:hypothetical protein